ncbi:MAG TPA: lytic transglycosylase domain-containing protein [Firmicutes bacterium]|nr:lytic transglycosylase domain-containing protein [Bacillota bacterium]
MRRGGGRGRGSRHWLLGLLAAAVFLGTLATSRPVLRLFFPIHYASFIAEAARTYRLDPHLLGALIRVESSFNPYARSVKGAVGLMQLMPGTADWIAAQRGLPPLEPTELVTPEVNIDYGSWYLRTLLTEFKEDPVLALAAYNSGRGTVRSWLAQRKWSGRLDEVEEIPFPETRAYVRRVLATWNWYERLYPTFPAR